jgi:hypothetical protein
MIQARTQKIGMGYEWIEATGKTLRTSSQTLKSNCRHSHVLHGIVELLALFFTCI